jgi:hypothetical protein
MTAPAGRPLRAKKPSTVTKRFRCSPAEARRWERKAKRAKLTLSEFIRRLLDAA